MKILPFVLACFSCASPICDYKVGNLFESNRYSNISLCSEGDLLKEDIKIVIKSGSEEIFVQPEVNIGYLPSIFVANFLDNGLEQILYSVESGGSEGTTFYEMFSFESGSAKTVFNSSEFKPNIQAYYENENLIKIDYQGKMLVLDSSISNCLSWEDCSLYISDVNWVLPCYHYLNQRYYIQVFQRIYAGYSANNLGYISSLLEINEDGYLIKSVGVFSNLTLN